MAASERAVPPVAGGGKPDGRSPPTATTAVVTSQSKRDRKRQVLLERLAAMSDRFQRDKNLTYRDQLQKIQFEMNLVQRFDPYDPRALETISELQKEYQEVQGNSVQADNARSLMDMAGIKFPDFLSDVEDLVETRDFQLAQSKVCCVPLPCPETA